MKICLNGQTIEYEQTAEELEEYEAVRNKIESEMAEPPLTVEEIARQSEQNAADILYLSMMSGIDLEV